MPPPSILDHYEITRRLGAGGMGEIFLAREKDPLGPMRWVVLKRVLPEICASEEAIEAFLSEARVAALLSHPGIVTVYEVGVWESSIVIAMEYVHGESLAALMSASGKEQARFPVDTVALVVRDAALALNHAHEATDTKGQALKLVHRDVSPQNIMLSIDGRTKVMDFGIVSAANVESRTVTGVVKGKFRYMSPEQARGGEIDQRSDQFSLGIVAWELCTGARLFGKISNLLEAQDEITKGPIARPSTLNPEIPPELEVVVMRMLEHDRAQRYPRLFDAAQDLSSFLEARSGADPAGQASDFVRRFFAVRIQERISGAPIAAETRSWAMATPTAATSVERPFPSTVPAPVPEKGRLSALTTVPGMLAILAAAGLSALALSVSLSQPIEVDGDIPNVSRTTRTSTSAMGAIRPAAIGRPRPPSPVEDQPREESEPAKSNKVASRTPRRPTPPARPGSLSLISTPWADVSIDGVKRGVTPLYELPLAKGPHTLRLTNAARAIDLTREITVESDQMLKLNIDLARAK